jgi:hypothetical protein
MAAPSRRSLRSWLWFSSGLRSLRSFLDVAAILLQRGIGHRRAFLIRDPYGCRLVRIGQASRTGEPTGPLGSDRFPEWRSSFWAWCFLLSTTRSRRTSWRKVQKAFQLLLVVFGASPHTSFADLAEPPRTVTWCIHFVAGTGNAPTASRNISCQVNLFC